MFQNDDQITKCFDYRSDRSSAEHLLLLGREDVRSGADDSASDLKESHAEDHSTPSIAEQL